jgi:hypothetical protein
MLVDGVVDLLGYRYRGPPRALDPLALVVAGDAGGAEEGDAGNGEDRQRDEGQPELIAQPTVLGRSGAGAHRAMGRRISQRRRP